MKIQSHLRLNRALTASLCAVALLLGANRAAAQANANPPTLMTFQGFLVDANGVPLGTNAPKNYDVIFRIWDAASGGTVPLWAEQQTVTVDRGNFSVLLGEGSSIGEPRPTLNTIFTNNTASDRWVGITVKGIGPGGSDANILPRLRLLTSPYAFLAHKAMSVDGGAVTSGTVPDNRLSSNVALRNGGNTFNNDQSFTGHFYFDNARVWYAKNTQGTYEPFFWPRWNDDRTYMNFGSGGFNLRDNNSVSRLYITGAGNVGIGTDAPGASLQVNGGIRARGGVPAGGGVNNNGYAFAGNGGDNDSGMFSTADGLIQFFTDSTEKMRINSAGNVGIGTTNPGKKVQIGDAGIANSEGMIRMSSRSGTGSAWRTWDVGVPETDEVANTGSGYSFVIDDIMRAGTDFIIRWNNGYVGLGTTEPSYPLTVRNDTVAGLRVERSDGKYATMYRNGGGYQSNGQLVFQMNQSHWSPGDIAIAYDGDNNWNFPSDRKLKKDIVDAESMLDRALKVQVRRYRWKNSPDDSKHMLGVIAQEVQPLFPDLVDELENPQTRETNLTVGYDDFALIAIKALQEFKQQHDDEVAQLKGQVEKLERQNAELSAKNKEHDERLAALERLVRNQQPQTAAIKISPVADRN